ncbi:hypothetical protein GCM10023215_22550 [Pseudonocardia yuanmonensis]|uniref:STAS domain-containing protein n=1 Tax=Pseudonocardia yuanmonensis TaxID=1095914 RepID=A0ABP8WBZ4_9PSEU
MNPESGAERGAAGPGAGTPAHLPAALPLLPDLRLAALWVPPAPLGPAALPQSDGAAPAGDWLDVVPLPGGRLALAVGDLVGPEPRPGAVTGLRTVLRQALYTASSLTAALEQVERAASADEALHGASLTIVVVGPDGRLEHARGAHPPALVSGPGGIAPVPGQAYGPLGVGAAPPVPETAHLAPGETLLLYSDDVVEGRGRGVGQGLRPAPDVPEDDPAALCALLAARAPRGGVAVLAAHRPLVPVRPLHLVLPVDPFALSPLRESVTRWLEAAGVAPRTVVAAPMVVSELAANVIQHAYPEGATGEIRVDVALTVAGLRISVADDGTWRTPEAEGPDGIPDPADERSGFGLAVVRDLCDELVVEPGPQGTTVTALLAVDRPVAVGETPRPGPAAAPEAFTVHTGDAGVLYVQGDVDLPAVTALRAALLAAAAGGVRCVLDLTGTTLFASAGVRLLHQLDPGTDLQVVAPPGSVARPVLELTGLGHLLSDRAESA